MRVFECVFVCLNEFSCVRTNLVVVALLLGLVLCWVGFSVGLSSRRCARYVALGRTANVVSIRDREQSALLNVV